MLREMRRATSWERVRNLWTGELVQQGTGRYGNPTEFEAIGKSQYQAKIANKGWFPYDLRPDDFESQRKRCVTIFLKNDFAASLLKTDAAICTRGGVQFQSEHDGVVEFLEDFVAFGMGMQDTEDLSDLYLNWQIYGELLWVYANDLGNPQTRVTEWCPEAIAELFFDNGPKYPTRIRLNPGWWIEKGDNLIKELRVINPQDRELEGDAQFDGLERVLGTSRSQSALYRAGDSLDKLEAMMFDGLRRPGELLKILYIFQSQGATEEDIQELINQLAQQKHLNYRVLNQKATMQPSAVDLAASEIDIIYKAARSYIAGGRGQPASWHGDGDETNRATAFAQGSVAMIRKDSERIRFFRNIKLACRVALKRSGHFPNLDIFSKDAFQIDLQPLAERDEAAAAATFATGAQTVMAQRSQGLLDKERTVEALAKLGRILGLEWDAQEILDALVAEGTEEVSAEFGAFGDDLLGATEERFNASAI